MDFNKQRNLFVSYDIYRHLKKKKFPRIVYRKDSYIPDVKEQNRNMVIVYQGKLYAKVNLSNNLKGLRFGNFVTTRRIMRQRNKKKRKNKAKRR